MQQKMKENSFTLNDYLEQFAMLKKMGGAQSLMSMLPGMGKLKVSDQDVDEKKIERTKAMILSMTPSEREIPPSSTAGASAGSPRVRARPCRRSISCSNSSSRQSCS